MVNKKITDYNELLTPDEADLLEVIDISETDANKNKKIKISSLWKQDDIVFNPIAGGTLPKFQIDDISGDENIVYLDYLGDDAQAEQKSGFGVIGIGNKADGTGPGFVVYRARGTDRAAATQPLSGDRLGAFTVGGLVDATPPTTISNYDRRMILDVYAAENWSGATANGVYVVMGFAPIGGANHPEQGRWTGDGYYRSRTGFKIHDAGEDHEYIISRGSTDLASDVTLTIPSAVTSSQNFVFDAISNSFTQDQVIAATKKLFFDGSSSGDTFIYEASGNSLEFHAGSATDYSLRVQNTNIQVQALSNFVGINTLSTRNTNGQSIAIFNFKGGDSASATAGHIYGRIRAIIRDNTNGAEDGSWRFEVSEAGNNSTIYMEFRGDLQTIQVSKDMDFQGNILEDFLIESFTEAGKPAAANAGRVIYNTDTDGLQFDDGTDWQDLARAWGSMYVTDGAGSQTMGTGFTKINQFTANGSNFNTGTDHTTDDIDINSAGDYLVIYSISFTSDTNNSVFTVAIFKEGVEQSDGQADRKVGTGADVGNMGGQCVVNCAANDTLDLRAKVTSGTPTMEITEMNLSVVKIG